MPSTRSRTPELWLRAAVESAPTGLLMVDAEGRIVLVNREIERMFGWPREDLMGASIEKLVPRRYEGAHPRFRRGFIHAPATRPMGAGRDLHGLRRDGTEIPIEIGLSPIETDEGTFVLSSVVDITERKRGEAERAHLEQQLRHVQKMDAVGTLAGGIAHDFNNILGAILGYGELLLPTVQDPTARKDLEELLAFTQRGKSLVEKIQTFGRSHEGERRPLDLREPVREVEGFFRSSLPPNISLRTQLHPRAGRVMADPSAIHQILMNLGLNGSQAMPEGGELALGLEPEYVADSRARAHPTLQEGHHVVLTVRDTGAGIPPEIQGRVFEPFFTTKAPGKGSGLGLAIVHGIVRDHGGVVELESAPGSGTTFRIILPALTEDDPEVEPLHAAMPMGTGERVLYVDDEPALGLVGQRRLEQLGYQVTVAGGGEAALEVFRADPEGVDVVITDYLMPGMNGLELALALTRLRPGLPIVVLTGFIDALPEATLREAGILEILKKPVTRAQLGEALARALGHETTSGADDAPA